MTLLAYHAAATWFMLGLIWIVQVVQYPSFALVQVRQHGRLGRGRVEIVIRRLVAGNWVRTAAWTARGALALALLV